jgi:hypothetical protein
LVDYAEHEFSLSIADQSGVPKREHLLQVEKQTGITPKDLEGPSFPLGVSHIWIAFLDLNRGRSNGMSVNPLSYQEIKAWMDITHTPLNARDIDAVKRLDTSYLGAMNG